MPTKAQSIALLVAAAVMAAVAVFSDGLIAGARVAWLVYLSLVALVALLGLREGSGRLVRASVGLLLAFFAGLLILGAVDDVVEVPDVVSFLMLRLGLLASALLVLAALVAALWQIGMQQPDLDADK